MLRLPSLICIMFQDSGCMPVLVHVMQSSGTLIIWSVDVCQTMGVCEQWLYANAEDSDQDLLLKRVSPSFTYKGVFTLLPTNTIIFIY